LPKYLAPATRTTAGLSGKVQVAIKLQNSPLVVAVGPNAKQNGIQMTAAQQRAYLEQLRQKQDAVMSLVRSAGGVELGRVSLGHNALMVSIDSSQLQSLGAISGVAAVRPLTDYKLSLSDQTLPYIGATAVQNTGVTGQGIRVAMLDSGIDYTHYNLGGSGNVADYLAAKAVASGTPPANLFPTAKVIGGYDFVGDVWPSGPLAPDANPIDLNGHGTHTADIVGGHSLDGQHVGTAPGTQLYAVKVCSSLSNACSSVAVLKGIDFALDPNNTGTVNHPVDIISMSIGSAFGQLQDDASEALAAALTFGVLSVVAAGDNGDIPYIVSPPAAQPEVLAVGATNSVTAFAIPLVVNSPPNIAGTYANTATLSFAPVNTTVTANVVYVGRGCPAGSAGSGSPADPYLANPSGDIALIDRGSCSVSLKIDAAARAGAVGVLIGLVAPGDAVSFSSGGGSDFVPTLVITQQTSNLLKNALLSSVVNATLSPNNAISLAGNVASFTSRGPNYSFNMLKPDLSAPGTVVAADAGTGNGQSSESGTSFACPFVAGSAALLLSKNHTLAPLDLKAILMETTEPSVFENAATEPGLLATLSRVGAGELRVDRAVAASTSVWDASDPMAVSLSFGTYRLNANQNYRKKVIIRNYSNAARTYLISNTYRDAPNQTGVTIAPPPSIFVPANGAASFNLTLSVNAAALPVWTLNGGPQRRQRRAAEYGRVRGLSDLHQWHRKRSPAVAHSAHKAANVQPTTSSLTLSGSPKTLTLSNTPAPVGGAVDVFSLTGTGVQFPQSSLPGPGSDAAVINLQAAGVRFVCLSVSNPFTSPGAQFAVTTFGQRSHPDVPAEFDVHIDINQDGVDDLVVFNADIGFFTTGTYSGQNGVFITDLTNNTTSGPFFYTVADLDSANAILTVPLISLDTSSGLQLGVSTPFTFSVKAVDNYFTHAVTDSIGPMKYELDTPQVSASPITVTVAPGTSTNLLVSPNGAYNGKSPSQTGRLLMYTDGKAGQESSTITVVP
jgi:subtilisin family serine protease